MKFTLVFTLCLVLMGAMMSSATPGCLCLQIYAPVCGMDGVTYGNSCHLNCAGVQLLHNGACNCS